jgi:methionyl-tRNA formyltransferase
MRLIFAGTPEFAAAALKSLVDAGHDIALVLTQPDRPAGRGMKVKASPVKELALTLGLPVAQPHTLKDASTQEQLRTVQADAMVVAAYGLILPRIVLDIPRLGCLNIHASLLPRWRGAAPIQRAILAGDAETGITIMQMDEGLDTGAMLLKNACTIVPADTAQTLHDKLAVQGGTAIVDALARIEAGTLHPEIQDNGQATYAAKLTKEEATIDWRQPAEQVARAVRAYNPFPVAHTLSGSEPLRVWSAQAVSTPQGLPGEVLAVDRAGILIGCGQGALRITELQRAGGKRLTAEQFVAGGGLALGERLGA